MCKGFPLSLFYEKITEQARLELCKEQTTNKKMLDLRKHYSLMI